MEVGLLDDLVADPDDNRVDPRGPHLERADAPRNGGTARGRAVDELEALLGVRTGDDAEVLQLEVRGRLQPAHASAPDLDRQRRQLLDADHLGHQPCPDLEIGGRCGDGRQ